MRLAKVMVNDSGILPANFFVDAASRFHGVAKSSSSIKVTSKSKGPEMNPSPGVWWRRGESNPRPQILRPWPYMLSLVFDLTLRNPTGRAANGGSGEF
jgi:hypothetical protein